MNPTAPSNALAFENEKSRVDVIEKVTGRAKYTTDHYPANMLWAQLIRCPVGKGKLKTSQLDAAKAVKGVLEVELTKQEGNYHGQPVGHILAETRQALSEAFAALKLEWERQSVATRVAETAKTVDAFKPDDEAKVNEMFTGGDIRQVSAVYETQVQTHCCLEPHGVIVDCKGDRATAWASTQTTFGFRNQIAEALGMPGEKVELHCEYVGGGFGSKFELGQEGELAARLSKKHQRPVRCMLTRKEEQLDGGMRPGSLQTMRVATGTDGRIRAARIHIAGAVGYTGGGGGASNPARYNFGSVSRSTEEVHLNSQFPRAMRAPGHPQGMFAVEMMMDELAAAVGMDPLEFRLKNDPNPVRQAMYREGAKLIGWERRQKNGSQTGALRTGLGIGSTDWGNSKGKATVDVVIQRSGQVDVYSGSQDIGTGFRTVLVDIVAHELGIPRERVTAHVGVSLYPDGPGSGGSVTTRFVAPKVFGAAQKAHEQLVAAIAGEWKVDPKSIKIENGMVQSGAQRLDWDKACKLLTQDSIKVSESDDGKFFGETVGSEGVQFAEVVVDSETGIVRVKKVVALQECGQPINRRTVENQLTGGVIQGLSFALFEDRVLNRQTGTMVNANMEFYKIAGPQDIPEIVPVVWRGKENSGPQSLGEPPVVPMPGAIGCAVMNAIGAPVRTLPITPARVLAAIAGKNTGGAQA